MKVVTENYCSAFMAALLCDGFIFQNSVTFYNLTNAYLNAMKTRHCFTNMTDNISHFSIIDKQQHFMEESIDVCKISTLWCL